MKIDKEPGVFVPPLQRSESNMGASRSNHGGNSSISSSSSSSRSKYLNHDSRARRRAALPLHAQNLTSVRRPLLKRLDNAFAGLAENTDSVESHVQ